MPYASHDGTRIYWEASGTGAPVLLVMGLGVTLEGWHRVGPGLAARYRTIVFDNRGVGRSDLPAGPYSIPGMAADARAVLDAAGVERAHVFGVSMGGMIAQEFALLYPARVRSLILGCTSCGAPHAVPARPEVLAALDARATMPREQAMWLMAPFIYDAATPRERIEQDLTIRLGAPVPDEAYLGQLRAIRAWGGSLPRLGGLAVPTLVVHGETDRLVPPENGRMLAQAIPGARLVLLPGAGHIFTTDRLDRSMDAVLSFLEECAYVDEQAVS